jgi:methionyl aminopeptidase
MKLMQVTQEALFEGIAAAVVGNRVGDISYAIQKYVDSFGYGIVRDFVGHGVGRTMHEEPQIPNYGKPHTGPELKAGTIIAIEPMINLGTHRVEVAESGWTVYTEDGLPSAHFEHTIMVTKHGPKILTQLSA